MKVATLKGDRPANTRLYKLLYWLETARREGGDVSGVLMDMDADRILVCPYFFPLDRLLFV